ncbi:MAG: YdaS family helix-turn-helix protein [Steroidobacteraceae bacterium]
MAKLGSQRALADALDVSPQAITNMKAHGRPIPPERVLEFERITGIPRTRIRPDLYPEDAAA